MQKVFVPLAGAFYTGMAVVAIVWAKIAGRPSVFWVDEPPSLESVVSWSVVGALFAGVVILGSDLAEQKFKSIRDLASAFNDILGDITWKQSFVLALLSSFGEEMLFRGAMMPTLGLVLSSLIFAAVHWPMEKRLMLWPLFALAIGLCFGWAFEKSGHIAGPIVAHFVINFVNLKAVSLRSSR